MSRIVSMQTKIGDLDGLRDTTDLTEWEQAFVTSILDRYLAQGKRTDWMTDKQTAVIEKLWEKHFA